MNDYIRPLDISDALRKLYPFKKWKVINDPLIYENLIWEEEELDKPSKEEIFETLRQLNVEFKQKEYIGLRSKEYPPLQDLADALYWQSKGDNSKMEAYVAACEAVKEKYPKGV